MGRNLVQKVAETEYKVSLLGTFLRGAWYGLMEWLPYPQTIAFCEGGGALLCEPMCTPKSLDLLGICQVLGNMVVDPVLGFVAIE